MTPKNKPNYNIKTWFDRMIGDTDSLITDFSKVSGFSRTTIRRYLRGGNMTLKLEFATAFTDFYNKRRHEQDDDISIDDLLVSSKNTLRSELNLTK